MKIRKIILPAFLIGLMLCGWFCWKFFGPAVHRPENGYFFISTGSQYKDVLLSIKEKGLLDNTFYFEWMNRYRHYDKSVKPGRYKITNGMSIWQLFSMLRNGAQDPVRFVINKCRTREELAARIGKYLETDSLAVIAYMNQTDSLKLWDVDTSTTLSLIIPNTYLIYWNANVSRIFKKFKSEHDLFWEGERQKKAASFNLSPLQVYILSSIVEEETNKESDKGKIASVYFNRLKKGMKLEADPTVKFAMKHFGLNRILHSHLAYESPYNTYLHNGLPPGPICTPSIQTMDEVLNMPSSPWLFFVAKPDFSGYSVFSETYAEHQVNAKKYQQALGEYLKKKQ